MRTILLLRGIAALGCLLALALFALVLTSPEGLKRSALDFTKGQIETEVRERFALATDAVPEGLQRLAEGLGVQEDNLLGQLDSDLPEKIAAVIERHCSCASTLEARTDSRAARIRDGIAARIGGLDAAQERLQAFIVGRYDATIAALRADVLIFLGTNLLAFAGVAVATFAPRERRRVVLVPGALLLVSVSIASYFYLFETNWFYTLLFNDFVGWGYAAGVGFIFGFLLDILVNRARVTLNILSNLPYAFTPSC